MIKHIVMLKLKDEAEGSTKQENAVKIKEVLDSLPAKIPTIKEYEVGINIKETERAYDVCLVSAFENMDELEIYLKHPEHVKAVEFIKARNLDSKACDYEV